MNVLVLNSGSSSLKFQVIDTDLEAIEKNADRQLARGLIERIGSESLVTFRVEGKPARAPHRGAARPPRRARLPAALARLAGGGRARASPRSATSTRSATASSTAARSSRAR